MKKSYLRLSNSGLLWAIATLIISKCPYLFVTFPIYLLINVEWALEFYKTFHSKDERAYSLWGNILLMIISLFMMIMLSYLAFSSSSFKAFNVIK